MDFKKLKFFLVPPLRTDVTSLLADQEVPGSIRDSVARFPFRGEFSHGIFGLRDSGFSAHVLSVLLSEEASALCGMPSI